MSIRSRFLALTTSLLFSAGSALADGNNNPSAGGSGSSTITANSTATSGFSANDLLQSDGSKVQRLASANNAVLSTNGSGVWAASTTLPSGLTIPGYAPTASPTFTGTVTMPDSGTWTSSGIAALTGLGLTSGATTNWNSDTFWQRDAAGILAISRGAADTGTVTSPAAERTYNLASSSLANYERMEMGFVAHSNVAAIDVEAGGTGTTRGFGIYLGGTIRQDYGVTQAGYWSLAGANGTLINNLTATTTFLVSTFGVTNYMRVNSTAATLQSVEQFGFASGDANANPDTILTRNAAAVLQHGAADAASPVAQTIRFQSVVAGNANTAAANATFQGSLSNGSGAGGDIIVKTTASSASSGAQNTGVEAVRFTGGTNNVKFRASTTGAGIATFTNSPCTILTTEQWIPVEITGQTGTWYLAACQ